MSTLAAITVLLQCFENVPQLKSTKPSNKQIKQSIPTQQNKSKIDAISAQYDMQIFLNNKGYKLTNKITKTSQGSIWKGITNNSHQQEKVVIKIASKDLVDNNHGLIASSSIKIELKENIIKEASILKDITNKNLNQQNVVQFIDFFNDTQNYFLIMSDGGQSLSKFVEICHKYIFDGKLQIKQWINIIKKIFIQIINLIDILHNKLKICHMDLSLNNFLIKNVEIIEQKENKIDICDNFEISICDFGSAECFENNDNYDCDKYVGKTRFVSPELFIAMKKKCGKFNAKSNDIWSLAVCLFIICIGWNPYNNPTDIDYQFRLINNGKVEQLLMMMDKEQYVTSEILDLLQKMFKKESERICLSEIKDHSFLRC